jgi:hypothetical protein
MVERTAEKGGGSEGGDGGGGDCGGNRGDGRAVEDCVVV